LIGEKPTEGRGVVQKLKLFFLKHPRIPKGILLGYIVFAGCFGFPFGTSRFPFDLLKAYSLIVSYGCIGLGFGGIYGKGKEKFVYLANLLLTGIGLICRYLLEFGEVSNTMNFTQWNVISYLAIIPVFTLLSYYLLGQYTRKKI
jgi:hypothetical protein